MAALVLAAAVGGWLASMTFMPVPWFTGGLLAAALWSAWRRDVRAESALRDAGFLLIGYAVGRSFVREFANGADVVVIAVGAAVAFLTWAAVRVVLGRAAREWGETTRQFAAVPGSMSVVLAVAADAGRCEPERVALVHLLRLGMLCLVLPLLALGAEIPEPAEATEWLPGEMGLVVALLAVSLLVARVARRVGVPAPALLSAVAVVAGAELVLHDLPAPPGGIRAVSAVLIAAYLGPTFRRAAEVLEWRDGTPAVLAAAAALLMGALGAGLLWAVVGGSWRTLVLGMAPGGLEVAVLTAAASGEETGTVVLLQLLRYGVALGILAWIGKKRA